MEVLMFITDKGVALDTWKAGDVIDIHPDGWSWSTAELTTPNWRIIRVPVLQSEVVAFLSSVDPQIGVRKRIREWGIDVSKLPNPALFSGARTQGIITLTRAQVVAAATKKP